MGESEVARKCSEKNGLFVEESTTVHYFKLLQNGTLQSSHSVLEPSYGVGHIRDHLTKT